MPRLLDKLVDNFVARLPLQFRVLYGLFLLRVVDLESLSIQADVPRFLGQFAGVLIMFSLMRSLALFMVPGRMTPEQAMGWLWRSEQWMLETTLLVTGLIAVVSWDNIFPDRRDVMVLAPLPLRPHTVLFAKLAAAAAVAGLGVLTLNCAFSCVLSLIMGGFAHFIPNLAAYWFTFFAAAIFLLASVLTVQGLTALFLPRRLFLRVSAVLQLAAFAFLLGAYFLDPYVLTPADFRAPANHLLLSCSPQFWFFALFNQLTGHLPPDCLWLVHRAWIALGSAVGGAVTALLLSYLRTMRKIVEEPDLVPGARGTHWAPSFGSRLTTAILQFSLRSLARSRQHRVVLAFYLGVGAAVAMLFVRQDGLLNADHHPLNSDFLVATFAIMFFAVVGLRSVYALPISLTANWVLRTTQLASPDKYIAATRRSLLLFAVAPVWLASALYGLAYRPLSLVAAHLVVLALFGLILTDLNLLGFYKVPFTCSYLPGKSNVQLGFWTFILAFVPLTLLCSVYELRALHHPLHATSVVAALAAAALALRAFNRSRSRFAVLYFEEVPEEVLTSLRLISLPLSPSTPARNP